MVENELHFLSWHAFRRMAPTLLQLEINRLNRVLGAVPIGSETHNALVRARYALRQFRACLEEEDRDTVQDAGAAHLRTALLVLAAEYPDLDAPATDTLHYIIDRVRALHARLDLIY